LLTVTHSLLGAAIWSLDVNSGDVTLPALARQLLRLPHSAQHCHLERLCQLFDDSGDSLCKTIDEAIATGEPFSMKVSIQTSGEPRRALEVGGTPAHDQEPANPRIIGYFRDITGESSLLVKLLESQRLLEAGSAVANIGHWRLDLDDNTIFWSDEVYRIHGYEPGEIRPTLETALTAYHPEDVAMVTSAVEKARTSGQPFSFRARIVRPDESVRFVVSRGLIQQEAGMNAILFGVFQDVTEQALSEERSQQWSYLVNETPEAVVICGAEGKIQWVNKAFERLTGYAFSELEGRVPGSMLQGPDTDPSTVAELATAIEHRVPTTVEILNYRKSAEPYWVRLSLFPRFDATGELAQFMSIQVDISEQVRGAEHLEAKRKDLELANFSLKRQRENAEHLAQKEAASRQSLEKEVEKSKRLQEELRRLANFDCLTGVVNRRYFMKRAENELQRVQRYGDDLHVIMFDIDRFKRINDEYGHASGDQVLKDVCRSVGAELREDLDVFGRLGGDEFALLVPHTSMDGALAFAERLRAAVREETQTAGIPATCSFGVASMQVGCTVESALKRADDALYEAKAAGRDRVVYAAES